MPHPATRERLYRRDFLFSPNLLLLLIQFPSDPTLLLIGEELSVRGAAWQYEVSEHTANHCRNSLQNQEPAPIADTKPVHMIKDDAGDGSAKNAGDGQPRQEQRDRLRSFPLA